MSSFKNTSFKRLPLNIFYHTIFSHKNRPYQLQLKSLINGSATFSFIVYIDRFRWLVVWYGSWIYSYLCNQCMSASSCEFESRLDEVYSIQHYVIKFVCVWRLVRGFRRLSSTSKTERHDITEILLKVALHTIALLSPLYKH